ncbi:MAG: ribonuclease III [Verrucomicrobiae bacterium]|nr:ribonuclease III [Verrucomicrobiae bacterium]
MTSRSPQTRQEMQALVKDLENKIGYHFKNPQLLTEALTHSSIALDRAQNPFDNERLEFLGDAVLQLVITTHLFEIFPEFEEGPLTKIRTRLVSRTALKAYASRLELGKYLIMGRGEETSGGRERSSILGDSFEALIGAIYLDSDFSRARKFILQEAAENLHRVALEPEEINPKGHLQELLQSKAPAAPCYEHLEERGKAHLKYFRCRVIWEGNELGVGEGRSKKEAEVAAATEALKRLQ